MTKRIMDGFQRTLGLAVGFCLVEADVGQFALDEIGKPAVRGRRFAASIGSKGGYAGVLAFEMMQDVLQPFLDPSQIAGTAVGDGFQPLQQIGNTLFEMSQRRGVVVADRHAVDTIRQGAKRTLEIIGIGAARWHAVQTL